MELLLLVLFFNVVESETSKRRVRSLNTEVLMHPQTMAFVLLSIVLHQWMEQLPATIEAFAQTAGRGATAATRFFLLFVVRHPIISIMTTVIEVWGVRNLLSENTDGLTILLAVIVTTPIVALELWGANEAVNGRNRFLESDVWLYPYGKPPRREYWD